MKEKVKPFVKWAGGKGSLLNQINKYYPISLKRGEIDCYKEYFYNIRNEYNSYKLQKNEMSVDKAVQFIFLNRTCFNGLYRVNK